VISFFLAGYWFYQGGKYADTTEPDIAVIMKNQFDQFISLEEAYARH